jgi:DNA-binding NarL/FixJ family response regulator
VSAELKINFDKLEVAVVENQPPSLRGLIHTLEQLGCTIAWTAKDDEEAKKLLETSLPAIVFVDLRLFNNNTEYEAGWQLIRHLIGRDHSTGIVICSGTPVINAVVLEAIRLGCSYIVKEDLWAHELEVIASALLAAQSGAVFLSREVANNIQVIVDKLKGSDILSDRELEVLELVADGLTNQRIAERMVLEVNTIRSHVGSILAKLGVGNRVEAANWYHRNYGG